MMKRIEGVLPVPQTAFHEDDSVDWDRMQRQVDWALGEGAAGICTGMVTEWLRLTADYKYISWEDIALFRNLPSQGGFGWRDQHTFGIGMEAYLTQRIIARMGWNYGKSPIREDVTFANTLFPAIYESHLGGGVEFVINECHSLSVSTIGTFEAARTDSGGGDLFSQLGEGINMGYSAFDLDVTWSVRF